MRLSLIHILVFAPKYRRKVIYKAVRRDIIEIIKKLCKEMKVEIIEGEACPEDVYKRQVRNHDELGYKVFSG